MRYIISQGIGVVPYALASLNLYRSREGLSKGAASVSPTYIFEVCSAEDNQVKTTLCGDVDISRYYCVCLPAPLIRSW